MVTDAGMQLTGVLDDEEELQQWLEAAFEECGWKAIREVSPHSSNVAADLIVESPKYGWFGIETKYIRRGSGNGGAGQMAKAHHQVVTKYRNKRYIGQKIDLWAVCPYIRFANTDGGDGYYEQRQDIAHTKPFFDRTGIGWINLDHYALSIQFVEAKNYGRVPVGKLAPDVKNQEYLKSQERYQEIVDGWRNDVDISKIRESVARKSSELHYNNPVQSIGEGGDV